MSRVRTVAVGDEPLRTASAMEFAAGGLQSLRFLARLQGESPRAVPSIDLPRWH